VRAVVAGEGVENLDVFGDELLLKEMPGFGRDDGLGGHLPA
jgi:predicted RNA-binding protein